MNTSSNRRLAHLRAFRIGAGACLAVGVFCAAGIAQPVRERVAVDVVEVRVSAADRSGAIVTDLKPEDVRLSVDDAKVPIDALEILPAQSGAVAEPGLDRPAAPSASQAGRTAYAIVIDESTVAIPLRREALGQILDFLDSARWLRRPTFLIGSFRLGSMYLDLPWTTELDGVRTTLKRLRDHPRVENSPSGVLTSRTSLMEFQVIRHRLIASLMEVLAAFPDDAAERRLVLVTGGKTLSSTLDVYGELVDGPVKEKNPSTAPPMQTVPDPSAVSSLADGFRDGFELWSRTVAGPEGVGNADVVMKANERDVAIVPVAAASPDGYGYVDVSSRASTNSQDQASGLSSQLSANQGLWNLARETGAGSVVLAGRAAAGLSSLDRGGYRLSFRFRGERGRFHRIELASNRTGVTLSYRHGFRLRTPEEEILDAVIANVLAPSRSNDASLSARLDRAASGGEHHVLTLRFSVPVERGGVNERPRAVQVVAVARGDDGSWTLPIRWSGDAAPAKNGGFEVSIPLRGAGRSRTWSVGLRDVATALEGYARMEPNAR